MGTVSPFPNSTRQKLGVHRPVLGKRLDVIESLFRKVQGVWKRAWACSTGGTIFCNPGHAAQEPDQSKELANEPFGSPSYRS